MTKQLRPVPVYRPAASGAPIQNKTQAQGSRWQPGTAPPVYRPAASGAPIQNKTQAQGSRWRPGTAFPRTSSAAFPARHTMQRMPSRTIQRLSINLQPNDFAIPVLVNLRKEFGAPAEKTHLVNEIKGLKVQQTEHIYVYGHGGTSEITQLRHTTIGGYDTASLA